jgi:CRP-like cAMP-binding protein
MPSNSETLQIVTTLIETNLSLKKLPNALIKKAKLVSIERLKNVFIKGDTPTWLFYLVSGSVSLNRCLENGTSCALQHIQRGFVSEASLFASVYHCNAVAQSESVLLAFPIAEFRQAFDEPDFRDFWIQSLSHEVRRLRTQVERLSLKTAAERILHYLESEGEYNRQISHKSKKDWSAELGITHEALYRALSELERKGLIECDYDRIALKSKPRAP